MDPLTAALILANTIAELIKLAIESQPPEVRAEFARMQLEDFKKWRELFNVIPKLSLDHHALNLDGKKTVMMRGVGDDADR